MTDTLGSLPDAPVPSDTMAIGAFSAATRISVRMLRHYDEHGVLVPASVDPVTGYRRYAVAQLGDAADLRRLRDVGFGVSALGALLAARDHPAYVDALRSQRQTLIEESHAASHRLTLIHRLLAETSAGATEGSTMNITITRTTVPARHWVTLTGTIPTYADEHLLWARFAPELERQGIRPVGPGGCLEHNEEFRESDVTESIFLPVAPGTTAQAPLEVMHLPEVEAVKATLVGPYSLISEAHAEITAYLQAHGLTAASGSGGSPLQDKVFNVYLTDPSTVPAAELVTEIHLPIR